MRWTPNQVVAYNLWMVRTTHGWTQEEAAERLEPYLGERWSRVVFSAAERSVAGKRIKQFSADDIAAFAAAFDLSPAFFFRPPPQSLNPGRLDIDVDAPDEIAPTAAAKALTPQQLSALAQRRAGDDLEKLVREAQDRERERLEALGLRTTEREDNQ